MIKGLIFDLDGTLLNTISDLANSVNAVLEDYGFETFSDEEYKLKVGDGFKVLIEKALPLDKHDLVDEALEKFLYYYDKNYSSLTKAYDGIDDLLHKLQNKGIKLAVNSNKRDDYTKSLINSNFKDINFVDIIGQTNGINKKPDPTAANIIIEKMGLDKSEVLYIGDSATDIKTASNAHLSSVGVDWGFRGYKELKSAGATYIVYKPLDILDLIND